MILEHKINDILKEPTDILCHQVNCQGKMGAGLALQIRTKFPEVYRRYSDMVKEYRSYDHKALLGKAQCVEVEHKGRKFYVCNLFGQFYYGNIRQTKPCAGVEVVKVNTDREALKSAINNLLWLFSDYKQPIRISIPYGMGCGLGGDNWEELHPVIVQAFANAEAKYKMNITLKIVKKV